MLSRKISRIFIENRKKSKISYSIEGCGVLLKEKNIKIKQNADEKIVFPIPFVHLQAQKEKLREQLKKAIDKVFEHGKFILGPEVEKLEHELCNFCGAKHAISCSNGTDALMLSLRALGVEPGDVVFVPSFTFQATAGAVAWLGAIPIFVDVNAHTFNLDAQSLEEAIIYVKRLGMKPKGIVSVDLFGQPADYDAINAIALRHNLWVIADSAQSFGASYKGIAVGNLATLTTTSFFPAKPLGCYGDGGGIFTNDTKLADLLYSLRFHGKGEDKYDSVRIGINARLDSFQAAILLEKLKIFPQEILRRQSIADFYSAHLKDIVTVPSVIAQGTSIWSQYSVLLPKEVDRKELMKRLDQEGIPTMIYYAKALHMQKAYAHFPSMGSLKIAESLSEVILSFPISGYIKDEELFHIVESVKKVIPRL